MAYKLTDNGVIKDGSIFIPEDAGNSQWQEYQSWLAAGNTPEPADETPTPEEEQPEKYGARAWYQDNPNAKLIFTETIPQIETRVSNLVDALFPTASNQNKNAMKLILTAALVNDRVLAKQSGLLG